MRFALFAILLVAGCQQSTATKQSGSGSVERSEEDKLFEQTKGIWQQKSVTAKGKDYSSWGPAFLEIVDKHTFKYWMPSTTASSLQSVNADKVRSLIESGQLRAINSGTFTFDLSQEPHSADIEFEGDPSVTGFADCVHKVIFRLSDDELHICFPSDASRPKSFLSDKETQYLLFVFTRPPDREAPN